VKPVNPAVAAKFSSVNQRQMATMVIYRPRNSLGAWVSPTVMLDGRDLISIANGRVFVSAIAPGRHVFEMDNKRSGTEVSLKAGSSVYLKVEIVPGVWHGSGNLTQVAPEQGEFEAKRLEVLDLDDIEDPSFR
jgi:hypothetical protein